MPSFKDPNGMRVTVRSVPTKPTRPALQCFRCPSTFLADSKAGAGSYLREYLGAGWGHLHTSKGIRALCPQCLAQENRNQRIREETP